MKCSTKYVLYASALLAFLAGEPGGEAVEETLPSALVSTVNMSEVITKLLERTMSEEEVQDMSYGIWIARSSISPSK